MLSNKNTKNANFLFIVDMLKDLLAQELITEKEYARAKKVLYEAYRRRYRISPLKIVHKVNSALFQLFW